MNHWFGQDVYVYLNTNTMKPKETEDVMNSTVILTVGRACGTRSDDRCRSQVNSL
jgi:hypothetical protein